MRRHSSPSASDLTTNSPKPSGIQTAMLGSLLLISGAGYCAQPPQQVAPPPASRESFALLVGVNHYSVKAYDTLTAPGNDVSLLDQLLVDKYSFREDANLADPQKHIRTLIGAQATHANIRDAFQSQLIDKAKLHPNATVVFYFSGHGSSTPDQTHRTLAPSDRGVNGVHDITDDELGSWMAELRKYTNDITFILDSCNSGARSKGLQDRLVKREIPPDSTATNSGNHFPAQRLSSRDLGNNFISGNDVYSSFYGCLRAEYCWEGTFNTPKGQVDYGVFTYYLVNALRSAPYSTYHEAILSVDRALPSSVTQHPQAEGNISRPLFGSTGDYEDPFVAIRGGPITGQTFTVAAGKSLGLQPGTFLALYKPGTRHLVGDQDKLASARVTEASDFLATATLDEAPAIPISGDAKVAVVTPFFGAQQLRFNLHANLPNVLLSPSDQTLIDGIQGKIKKNYLIAKPDSVLAGTVDAGWDVGLQKGCAGPTGQPIIMQAAFHNACSGNNKPVFYLVTPDLNNPLYDFWISSSDPNAPEEIARRVELRAKQQALRNLTNNLSPFKDQVTISLVTLHGEAGADGAPKPVIDATGLGAKGTIRLPLGQNFYVDVHNATGKQLDVALLVLASSGRVRLLTPNGTGQEVNPGADLMSDVYTLGVPRGLETYLAIAYTPPPPDGSSPNFSLLEQSGGTPDKIKAISTDPLSWLVSQAAVGRSRDPIPSNLDLASWTIAKIDVLIQ